MKRLLLTLFVVGTLSVPLAADGATFNPNYIIADADLEDGSAMTALRVQSFLERRGGELHGLTFATVLGVQRASDVIASVGALYRISQKVLLVILQKEQSLLTDPTLSEDQLAWATGYGVCDSCSKDDPAIQPFRGFINQVTSTAKRIRESYLADLAASGRTISGWGPGIEKTTPEGDRVRPVNKATAVLYTYTPHVAGNRTFWNLWTAWFLKRYPDGTLLRAEGSPTIFLIKFGQKRPFLTRSAFLSRADPNRVITVSRNEVDAYETGPSIRFPNFSLVRTETGKVYLLVDDERRHINSPETFRSLGFNPEEIVKSKESELTAYSVGEKITLTSSYPTGALIQLRETGGIYFVQNGVKHAIVSREILRSRYPGRPILKSTLADLDQYSTGEPVKFRDGELVTSPGSRGIYVISNGEKRGIASKEVFDALGYRFRNVIRTTDRALELHPTGDPVTLEESPS